MYNYEDGWTTVSCNNMSEWMKPDSGLGPKALMATLSPNQESLAMKVNELWERHTSNCALDPSDKDLAQCTNPSSPTSLEQMQPGCQNWWPFLFSLNTIK